MSNSDGFTLVELLAAMVAGTLLLIGIGWAMNLVTSQYVRPDIEPQFARIEAITPIVVDLIETIAPPEKSGFSPSFSGARMAFNTAPPSALGPVGLLHAELSVENDVGGKSLKLHLTSARTLGDISPATDNTQTVVDGMREIRFIAQPGVDDRAPNLPRLVTIEMITPRNRLYRISAIPQIDNSGSCRFDPISMACRP